jgi:2-keto-4-pentenoate hydratase/2-oxohepta-3-ene-1,7-dioic acid hydratase in catechol pathway
MISDTLIHKGAMSMTVTPLQADFEPGKIIALHLNYPSRIAQRGRTPAHPSFFLMPITSLAT